MSKSRLAGWKTKASSDSSGATGAALPAARPATAASRTTSRPGFGHHFAEIRPLKWFVPERHHSSSGVVPRFVAIRPATGEWRLTADYFGLARYEPKRD